MKMKLSLLALTLLASSSAFAHSEIYTCGSFTPEERVKTFTDYAVCFENGTVTLRVVNGTENGLHDTLDILMVRVPENCAGEHSQYTADEITANIVSSYRDGQVHTKVEISNGTKTLNCTKSEPIP